MSITYYIDTANMADHVNLHSKKGCHLPRFHLILPVGWDICIIRFFHSRISNDNYNGAHRQYD